MGQGPPHVRKTQARGGAGREESRWLKWRLVPGGDMDFEYHGEKIGFDYGIDVAVLAGVDNDVVDLEASGIAELACDSGDFPLSRTGPEGGRSAMRCWDELGFLVLLPVSS